METLEGLKGLTALDRAAWEQRYAKQLKGVDDEKKNNAWINWNLQYKFGNDANWDSLKNLSQAEKIDYYNNNYNNISLEDKIKELLEKELEVLNLRSSIRNTVNIDTILNNRDTIKSDAIDTDVLQLLNEIQSIYDLKSDLMKLILANSEAFNKALTFFTDLNNKSYQKSLIELEALRQKAKEVSPYWNKYNDTDYFNGFNWEDATIKYNANKDTYGEQTANLKLAEDLQRYAAKNQAWYELYWRGLLGMGVLAYGAMLSTAGMLLGAGIDAARSKSLWNNDLNIVENIGNNILDNSITRYANDVITYGTTGIGDLLGSKFASLEEAKKSGISDLTIISTPEAENGSLADAVFNKAFIPQALSSQGFTLASLATGYAANKLTNALFKTLKGATIAQRAGATSLSIFAARQAIERLNKIEGIVQKYGIPTVAGTMEGGVEGLLTKLQAEEDNIKLIQEQTSKNVDKVFNDLISTKYNQTKAELALNNPNLKEGELLQVTLDTLYKEAFDSLQLNYEQDLEKASADAARAGIANFWVNSTINGLINQSLKATIFSPNTLGQLRLTKVGRLIAPSGKFKITNNNGNYSASISDSYIRKVYNSGKEILGELVEESAQDVGDVASRAANTNDLQEYIDVKYNGAGEQGFFGLLADNMAAAAIAAGKETVSKDFYLSGIQGAVGAVLGTPWLPKHHMFNTLGRLRSVGSNGKKENYISYVLGYLPWRSGILGGMLEYDIAQEGFKQEAKEIQDWLNTPEGRQKYESALGVINWALELEKAAESKSEVDYRTKALGKLIHDAVILNKIKDTETGKAILRQMDEVASLEEGSLTANEYLNVMRNNVEHSEAFQGKSDADILATIKESATKLKDTFTKVLSISDKLDNLVARLDTDTKETLIYGELQMKKINERLSTMSDNIAKLKIDNTVSDVDASDAQKSLIAQYGTYSKAMSTMQSLKTRLKNLRESKELLVQLMKDLAKSKDQESLTLLFTIANKLNSINRDLATVNKSIENLSLLQSNVASDNTNIKTPVLSEKDVLNLSEADRAEMLNEKNLGRYSEALLNVILNLKKNANIQDNKFDSKVLDMATLTKLLKLYVDSYNNISSHTDRFDAYIAKIKRDKHRADIINRASTIANINDYNDFALELDKVALNSTESVLRTTDKIINEIASENTEQGRRVKAMYAKYKSDREKAADVLDLILHTKYFDLIDDNSVDLIVNAIRYAIEHNLDITDVSSLVEALSATTTAGRNALQDYIDKVNKEVDESMQTKYTSADNITSLVTNAINQYLEIKNNKDIIDKPLEGSSAMEGTPNSNPPTPSPANLEDTESSLLDTSPLPTLFTDPFGLSTQKQLGTEELRKEDESQTKEETPERADILEPKEDYKIESDFYSEFLELDTLLEVKEGVKNILNILNNSKELSKDNYITLAKLIDEVISYPNSKNTLSDFAEFKQEVVAKLNNAINQASENSTFPKAATVLTSALDRTTLALKSLREQKARALEQAARQKRLEGAKKARTELLALALLGASLYDQEDEEKTNRNATNVKILLVSHLLNVASVVETDTNFNPLLKYLIDNNAVESIRTLTKDHRIYFQRLPEEIRNDVAKRTPNYNRSTHEPILVVAKMNGTYNPIGILPATNNPRYQGSGRLSFFRGENIRVDDLGFLMNGNDRLSTSIRELPVTNNKKEDSDYKDISIEDMFLDPGLSLISGEQINTYANTPKSERHKDSRYLNFIRFLLKRITRKQGDRGIQLWLSRPFRLENGLYDFNNNHDIPLSVTPVSKATSKNSNSTLKDVLNNNDSNGIIHFNSRIEGILKTIEDTFNSIVDPKAKLDLENNKLTDSSRKNLDKIIENYQNKISNYIRSRTYSFNIDVVLNDKNKLLVQFYILDGQYNKITLANINEADSPLIPTFTDEVKKDIIRNIFSEGGKLDIADKISNAFNFQVNYNNFELAAQALQHGWDIDRNDWSNTKEGEPFIFDNKVLGADAIYAALRDAINSIEDGLVGYTPLLAKDVIIVNPFNTKGELVNGSPVTTGHNPLGTGTASLNSSTDGVVLTAQGAVNPETGAVYEVKNLPDKADIEGETPEEIEALKVVKRIVDDSKKYTVSEDETTYINTEDTEDVRARVTSVIDADELEEDSFDNTSPYKIPSTNIGTGVDEFIRDVIAERIVPLNDKEFGIKIQRKDSKNSTQVVVKRLSEVYPNASEPSLQVLARQAYLFKSKLNKRGITLIPRDIKVTGEVDVRGEDGNTYKLPVAGTVDLLGFDVKGDFYLFDIKTIHNLTGDMSRYKDREDKYRRLLTLYKQFLEEKYGINVKEMGIIPIGVKYPNPGKNVTYKVSAKDKPEGYNGVQNNQVILVILSMDPKHPSILKTEEEEFKDATPKMINTEDRYVKVLNIELNIKEEKLKGEYKSLLYTQEEESTKAATSLSIDELNPPPNSFLDFDVLTSGGLLDDDTANFLNGINIDDISEEHQYIPSDLKAEDNPELSKALEDKGISAEDFNNYSEGNKRKEVDCIGH